MVAAPRRVTVARILHRLAFAIFTVGLVIIPFTAKPSDSEPINALSTEALRIAVIPGFPPFAYFDSDQVEGIEIDLGMRLGELLGVPVHFHPTGFDGVYDVVTSGTADIAIAQVRFNPLRTQEVLYTRPYYNAGLVLVTPVSSPIHTITDLGGKVVAFAFGSESDTELTRWSRRVSLFERAPYELPAYALDAVRLGTADAALVNATSAGIYQRNNPDWPMHIIHAITVDPFSIIVDRRNEVLWKHVDEALSEILDSGEFQMILNDWFGSAIMDE